MRRAAGWLAETSHLVVVRDHRASPDLDPELHELLDEEWQAAIAGLPAELVDWRTDADCHEALRRARAARHAHASSDVAVESEPATTAIELPVGPWTKFEIEGRQVWRGATSFANQLAIVDGIPVLRTGSATAIELAAMPAHVAIASLEQIERDVFDANPERRRMLPGYIPLGVDPVHPIGWRGTRMHFDWHYRGTYLSGSDRDWPCGPAKKLYGYADNEPVQVIMAPSASCFVGHFEHDVLLASSVPICWQAAGDLEIEAVAPDPLRAVFFAQDPDHGAPRDPDLEPLDEDARDAAPALVLGPDDAARYAVDLSWRVYRIVRADNREGGVATSIGGPGEGYAVFDAEHRLVRRGSGRLLGGWLEWATIEHAGHYWREHLSTGERRQLAPVDDKLCVATGFEAIARDAIREGRFADAQAIHDAHATIGVGPCEVLAIPGTRNVLLVGRDHIRVV